MYKQVKAFNQNTAGKQKGYCLQNVRKGYGIAAKYSNAIQAWDNTQQHKDRSIPSGVAVPLFYTFMTDGHVNVQLADGKLWSDGTVYANLAAYEKGHPSVHYIGWGESLNGERVLEHVADPVNGRTLLHLNKGTDTTFYRLNGTTFTIHAKDDSYDYTILEDLGNKVRVNSASGGGNGWIYMTYTATGKPIPGRWAK